MEPFVSDRLKHRPKHHQVTISYLNLIPKSRHTLKKRSTALTLDESMRAGIIPGFSSLDRGIPEAEVEFESRTF
ncbi:hypothetical protein T265_10266 [Opisthorchis viverrini]|uniref:Uncharacterized protein n=1 Tax=Opisthorchis viverrini TaxID=6198 RepID=A0A074Z739_OPIVI|nr:hypothetical protein T265_10266 [Opisthorchis viverrini]KER21392.1 hypothetical protein T265_10266 [Opisthorchis viverrini]